MAAIITDQIRILNAKNFVAGVTSTANSYYSFIGLPNPTQVQSDWDTDPPSPKDNFEEEDDYWDTMVALKKINSSDVRQVVPRRVWSSGTTYDMYKDNYSSLDTADSGASSLYTSTAYFRTSANRVYKVISNIPAGSNTAAAAYSGSEPTTEGTSLFTTGGYVLKYMYTISASNSTKFLTTDFIPVATDSTVSVAATDGAIESFQVTNLGAGCTEGTYYAAIYGDGSSAGTSSGAIARLVIGSD